MPAGQTLPGRLPDAAARAGPVRRRRFVGFAVAAGLLALGLLDALQLYVFENLRGSPLSALGALARNGPFWLLWIPIAWAIADRLAEPLSVSRGKRWAIHGTVALSVGVVHLALWVVAREVLAHGHFRPGDYPVLLFKHGVRRLGVDIAVYAGLLWIFRRSGAPAAQGVAAQGAATRPSGPAGTASRRPAAAPGTPSPAPDGPEGSASEALRLRSGGTLHLVDPDRIDWVEAAGDYMRLHEDDGDTLVRITLKELSRRLGPRFLRVSRSALVPVDRIRQVKPAGRDRWEIVLRSGITVPATAAYIADVEERLNITLS